MPTMSWDKPIEQEILEYVTHMANKMERVAGNNLETGWFKNNRLQEDAGKMATAYNTVREHIEREIKFRNSIKKESVGA